jgi:outer membrane biosynthesis protein TonB
MSLPASVGRYRILAEIGRGAMGAVYRAEDPKLGRTVAVKMISAAMAGGDDRAEVAARFEREARVAARLAHPNVVAVYDAGAEGNSLYLVMELVEGDTLAQRLARGQFPSTAQALELAAQAADALTAAHEAGVIHRDVKPGNLLLDRRGRVKVSDFGVAKAVGEQTELTRTGMMVGSPAYMAPEQIKGMPLDGRCDLFSLGVVLFELIVHRKPFPADTVTTLVYQILHEDPLRDERVGAVLPSGVASFLSWVLAKDREARIPDARTFAARARQLAADLESGAIAAETAPTARLAQPSPATGAAAPQVGATAPTVAAGGEPRRPRLALWVGLGALAVLVIAGLALMARRPPAPEVGRSGPEATLAAAPLVQPPAPEPVAPELKKEAPKPKPAEPPPAQTANEAQPEPVPVPAATPPPGPAPETATPATGAESPPAAAPAAEAAPAAAVASAPAPPLAGTFETRGPAEFHVDPEDTIVIIEGKAIGKADDWDNMGGGKQYVFKTPGEYLVELRLEGYKTAWIKIVVRPDSKKKYADVDTSLEEADN